MNNIKKLISALPPPHKQLLSSLCVLLRKISEHAKVRNKFECTTTALNMD